MSALVGKVILITGAGRGSGRELALSLGARGAILVLNDISPVNVDAVAAEIVAAGGQARVYLHDVAKKVAVQALVNQALDDFGRIDILIQNANVEPPAGLLAMDEWDLHRVFEVNTVGAFLMMQSVARVMAEQGGGVIFNLLGNLERNLPPASASSRRAVAELTRRASAELERQGVRVVGLEKRVDSDAQFSNLTQAVLALAFSRAETGQIFGVCA